MITRSQSSPTHTSNTMEDYDFGAILARVSDIEQNVERSASDKKALENKGTTQKHWSRCEKAEGSFVKILCSIMDKDGNSKWNSLFEEVPNPNKCRSIAGSCRRDTVPKCFVMFGGDKNNVQKRELLNAMLCDWQLQLKMVKQPKKGKKCPYYQPATQLVMLRSFFGFMKKEHCWQWTDTDFMNFKGCLAGVLSSVFKERQAQYGDEGYGKRDTNCEMTEDESSKIDFSKVDVADLRQLQMLLMIGFGALMGFRGNKEHTQLMFSQIGNGFFGPDHPVYPGMEWYGVTHFLQDKTHKLSVKNSYSRENGEAIGRFPVIPENPAMNFGGYLKLYCSYFDDRTGRFYRKVNAKKNGFTKCQPIGKDMATKMMREGFQILGIKRWDSLKPHALRSHFASILANDPSINDSEKLATCRHRSLKTNQKYQSRGKAQEARRLNALLGPVSPSPATEVITKPPAQPEKLPTPEPSKPSPAVSVKSVSFSPQLQALSPPRSQVAFSTLSPTFSTTSTTFASATVTSRTDSTAPTPEYYQSSPDAVQSTEPPRHHGTRSTATANDYSIHTQMEINGLYNDLEELDCARAMQHQRIVSMRRAMSDREREVRELRRTVNELRRDMTLTTFPYRSNEEEHNSLINDYLYNERENTNDEHRRRSFEAMMRWENMRDLNRKRRRGDQYKRKSW